MWLTIAFVGIPLFGLFCLAVGFAVGVMAEHRAHRFYRRQEEE